MANERIKKIDEKGPLERGWLRPPSSMASILKRLALGWRIARGACKNCYGLRPKSK
jgi:hypothetical protein